MRIRYRAVHPYVSRGGMKLAAALDRFSLSPDGLICLDVGSSAGGFTQVLLEHRAKRVYCVDVGHDQFHRKLLETGRVVLLEQLDARSLTPMHIPERPQAITADLSFISLRQALGPALSLAEPGAWAVLLVKPQFESGRHAVSSGGLIRDPEIQEKAVARVMDWFVALGWEALGVTESPITGKEGNREYLLAGRKPM